MRALGVLLRYKLHELRNYSRTPLQLLTWLAPGVVAIITFCLLHRWLAVNHGYIPLIFVSGVLLVLVLGLLTGFASLFANRENPLLLTAPVAFPAFLAVRYLDRLPWDLELALPVGLAAALALGSLHGYLPALLLLCSGAVAAGILSCLLVILAAYLCGNQGQVLLLLTAMAVSALPVLLLEHLQELSITPRLLGVANAAALAVVMLLALLVTAGGSRLGSLYFSALARMQSGKRHGPRLTGRLGYRLLGFFSGPVGALIGKDYLFHARTPMQWVRLLLLITVVGLYSLLKEHLLPPGLLAMPFLNVAAVLVAVHLMTGEVPVAAFAAEADRIRLLLAAPVSAGQLILAKYLSHGMPVVIMGLLCLVLLGVGSGSDAGHILISAVTGAAMLFGVTAALVGLGAAGSLPDKEMEGYVDRLMIEQTPASSVQALLAYGAGTVLLIADIAAIAVAYRPDSGIGRGAVLIPAVACLNLLLGLSSLRYGAWWVRKRLGAA
jgi:hypothetical protein